MIPDGEPASQDVHLDNTKWLCYCCPQEAQTWPSTSSGSIIGIYIISYDQAQRHYI